VRLLGHWTDWVHAAGFTPDTIHAGYDASAKVFKGKLATEVWLRAGALFIHYLQERGVIAIRPRLASTTEVWPILGLFRDWMRSHRGVTESTLDVYQQTIVALLEKLGAHAQAYSAQAVRDFVLERARPHGHSHAKLVATATRAFLRYLAATGQCPAGREYAVPGFTGWQLKPVPDFLGHEDIARLLAVCEGENRLRDRAIILLLVRLGLRASEVADLEFSHIDWKNGRIAVSGKSRRASFLPLPQEVGDALIAYIGQARPRVATPRVFLRDRAPHRPMPGVSVTTLVWRALKRARIESPRRGAHILRHSAATAMLRHGVSLSGVSAVLRHRSLRMTLHYAKVDFALLAEIAQPWAGRPAC
jgi:integrase